MKNLITLIFFLLTLACYQISYGQVPQAWVQRYNGLGNSLDIPLSTAIDGSGNVYVTGYSTGSGTALDYTTIKYNAAGAPQWTKRYNGPGNGDDKANSIAVDGSGNVYITGYSLGSGTGYDYATIKYNSSGVQQWVQIYNGPGNGSDVANSIAVDDSGNVYISGSSTGIGSGQDYATLKYNSSGVVKWIKIYNGTANGNDAALFISIDSGENVYVTGNSSNINGYNDYATIKYDLVGVQQWVQRYNGPGDYDDEVSSLAVDNSGNVYITGFSVGVGTDKDIATIKYNSSGVQQWLQRYNGPGNWDDRGSSIALDNSGNVYVGGFSKSMVEAYDFATIKYNSSGALQWAQSYNGIANSDDRVISIALDDSGNVYSAGFSKSTENGYDYATIKYNSSGVQQWLQTYNGPANNDDGIIAMKVSNSGDIYVTGDSHGIGTDWDWATIKYSPPSINVNLKILMEGMYYPLFNQLSRKDTIKVFLRNSTPPYSIIDSSANVIDSNTFSSFFEFSNALSGTYYIVAKHFNCIETWSKIGGEILVADSTIYNYDFTASNTQAYGNNLKLKSGKYCLYSGDVNQDGAVNLTDLVSVYNRARHFDTGDRLPEDLTGDSVVDLSDLTLCYNNSGSFIHIMRP